MRKQECSPSSQLSLKPQHPQTTPYHQSLTPTTQPFPSKNEFVEWLKGLSNHERYLAVQVKSHKMVSLMRNSFKRLEEDKFSECSKIATQHAQKGKNFHKNIKAFIQGLVFMSAQYHLDSVGFDFNLVQCPERIYDLLTYFKEQKTKKPEETNKDKKCSPSNFDTLTSKEEWVLEVVKFFRKHLPRMYNSWNPQILQDEKFKKIEYSFFWKNLSAEEKLQILFLDSFDSKQLLLKLIDMDILLNPTHLEDEIEDLMQMDKNDFCNRIFKCKLKKSSSHMYSYYGLIYNKWKDCVEKSRKKRSKKHKKKNIKKQNRNRSLGGYSNETNQTQYKEEVFDINIQQITMKKLEQDIIDCSDWISQRTNKLFDRRVLAFERVQNLLKLYDFNTKLYGSCASGITIENSDVDMALDDKILQFYQYLPSIRDQLEAALEYLSCLLEAIPWITKIKLIKTAKIPIIKMNIDTEIAVKEQFFSEVYRKYLNRPIKYGGTVCIDLTIQTKNEDSSSSHLGILSTLTIQSWLNQIPTLRPLVLLLKYHLARRELNQTYSNGLNTYALMVMIIAYLGQANLREQKSVALSFSKLLTFYGWQFDEKVHKIDLLSKEVFCVKEESQQNCACIQIIDPLEEGRNMTRNCYRFDEIKQMMREISKKCINRTINEVQELCSSWDPKKQPMTNDQLYEMVVNTLRDNYFISQFN